MLSVLLWVFLFLFLGALFDHTGNYNATYYFAGSAVILTGILSVVAFIMNRASSSSLNITSPATQRSSLLQDDNTQTYGIVNEGARNGDNTSIQHVV